MYYSTTYLSPLGKITLACDACGKNLVGLWLEGQKYYQGTLKEALIEKDAGAAFRYCKKVAGQIIFQGRSLMWAELPLAPQGNAFRQGVWEILCTIPYGEVITYGSIAKKMAVKLQKERMSSQAVGGAVGHNPISIIIPCHRSLVQTAVLLGMPGGIEKKNKNCWSWKA